MTSLPPPSTITRPAILAEVAKPFATADVPLPVWSSWVNGPGPVAGETGTCQTFTTPDANGVQMIALCTSGCAKLLIGASTVTISLAANASNNGTFPIVGTIPKKSPALGSISFENPSGVAETWTSGTKPTYTTPPLERLGCEFQIELCDEGHAVFGPTIAAVTDDAPKMYQKAGLPRDTALSIAAKGLPFIIRFNNPQMKLWSAWKNLPIDETSPLCLQRWTDEHGVAQQKVVLSPWGPAQLWYDEGVKWGNLLVDLYACIPNPSKLMLLNNNEDTSLDVKHLTTAFYQDMREVNFEAEYGSPVPVAKQRMLAGQLRALLDKAFWDGVISTMPATWQASGVLTSAYKIFTNEDIGLSDQKTWACDASTGRMNYASTGYSHGNASGYQQDFSSVTDFTVKCVQMDCCSERAIHLREEQVHAPGFRKRYDVWDGNGSGTDAGSGGEKRDYYESLGQTATAGRYAGCVECMMWIDQFAFLTEFRNNDSLRLVWEPWQRLIVEAVDRVWRPFFQPWWRDSELLLNAARSHPYASYPVPGYVEGSGRVWLLENSRWPATMSSDSPEALRVPIWVIAWARYRPNVGWLVFAQSPAVNDLDPGVWIQIPTASDGQVGPQITVDVPKEGAFWLVGLDGSVRNVTDEMEDDDLMWQQKYNDEVAAHAVTQQQLEATQQQLGETQAELQTVESELTLANTHLNAHIVWTNDVKTKHAELTQVVLNSPTP